MWLLGGALGDSALPIRPRPFDDYTVHNTSRCRIERLAPMHHAAIVPHDDVSETPIVAPDYGLRGRMSPQLVEKRIRFFKGKTDEASIRAAAKIEAIPAGFRVCADQRMDGAGRLARVWTP